MRAEYRFISVLHSLTALAECLELSKQAINNWQIGDDLPRWSISCPIKEQAYYLNISPISALVSTLMTTVLSNQLGSLNLHYYNSPLQYLLSFISFPFNPSITMSQLMLSKTHIWSHNSLLLKVFQVLSTAFKIKCKLPHLPFKAYQDHFYLSTLLSCFPP